MIAIGILSYKRTDLLVSTLKDICKTSENIELIILNNNDDFCIQEDILNVISHKNNINLKYIYDNYNYGVGKGRRKLIEECTSDYIIMLDDDVSIPNVNVLIQEVKKTFSSDDLIKGIAFNIKEFQTGLNNRYEIPHKNKNIDLTVEFNTYLMIGAGHALDVDAVKEAGNYPNDLGLYGFEEIDLSLKLINCGYHLRYNPNLVIMHKKSPDGRFSGETVNYLFFVNRTKIAKRHLKLGYFISCFFIRSIYFLLKTNNWKLYVTAVNDIRADDVRLKFNYNFYKYVRSVKGFLLF